MQRGAHTGRDVLDDLAVGLDQAVEHPLRLDAMLFEHRHGRGVPERRVHRPVELHVPRPGGDRLGDLLALDLDHPLDHVRLRRIDLVGHARDVGEREPEDRRRREGHLERVVRETLDERRLVSGRTVDLVQFAVDHRKAGVVLELAFLVGEGHLTGPGGQAVNGVVERAGEHEAAKLAVRDDVQADVELASHGVADRLVLRGVQLGEVLGPFLGQQRGVAGLVDLLDEALELGRPQQASHVLGSRCTPGCCRRRHLVCRGRTHGSSFSGVR